MPKMTKPGEGGREDRPPTLPSPYRVLVCGDRNWTDQLYVQVTLDRLLESHPEGLVIIEGCAKGADASAERWAHRKGLEGNPVGLVHYPADWAAYGKRAGPIRNLKMLRLGQPDEVHAFHDDLANSKDTAGVVRIALAAGVRVELHRHLRPAGWDRSGDARHLARRAQEAQGLGPEPFTADEEHDPRFTDEWLGGPRA